MANSELSRCFDFIRSMAIAPFASPPSSAFPVMSVLVSTQMQPSYVCPASESHALILMGVRAIAP
ncbi:MAG TPA: hypothetical protein V6C78_30960 [Crinalium sp.]